MGEPRIQAVYQKEETLHQYIVVIMSILLLVGSDPLISTVGILLMSYYVSVFLWPSLVEVIQRTIPFSLDESGEQSGKSMRLYIGKMKDKKWGAIRSEDI